jgi:hypothetical protein
MRRLLAFCTKVKVIAVELTALAGFLLLLGWALYWEWNHLFHMAPK